MNPEVKLTSVKKEAIKKLTRVKTLSFLLDSVKLRTKLIYEKGIHIDPI